MIRPADAPRFLSPPQVARRLAVTPETVIGWIRRGELRGYSIGLRTARRPRYRIDPADLETFLAGRAVVAPARVSRTRRRRPDPGYVEYF